MSMQTPTIDQVRNQWDALAVGFDEFVTPHSTAWGEQIVRRIDVGPGVRFLDVAAGSGALSLPAARLGAQVVATDISPAMVGRLTRRAQAEGLTNVETLAMDGQALKLPDDTFDVAVSQNGVTLFPDLDRGLRELVRVIKPGGLVLIWTCASHPRSTSGTWSPPATRSAPS